jgi:hypothetical protein
MTVRKNLFLRAFGEAASRNRHGARNVAPSPPPLATLAAVKLDAPMYRSHDSFENSLRQSRSGMEGPPARGTPFGLHDNFKDYLRQPLSRTAAILNGLPENNFFKNDFGLFFNGLLNRLRDFHY